MTVPNQAPVLPEEQLARNFAEIAPPLTPDAAALEANTCLFCYDAPCTAGCPTHIDVPSFIRKIASGNLRGAARVILDANPFGHSCARACPVEVLCEGACVLNQRDEQPIKIALLQRHATDHVLAHRLRLFEPGPPSGKRVAVVGAGPAGLSCARDLVRRGHAVTVFEAQDRPGGLNTFGIAEYKMTPAVALAEVADILELGIELRTGVMIGRDVSFDTLLADWKSFRHAMLRSMETRDCIVCPVARDPAPLHGATLAEDPMAPMSFSLSWSLTGWPVVVVRAGTSRDGLPIGVQLVARPWREEIALAAARVVERELGPWPIPPLTA